MKKSQVTWVCSAWREELLSYFHDLNTWECFRGADDLNALLSWVQQCILELGKPCSEKLL